MCTQMVKTVLGVGRVKSGLCLANGRGKEAGLCTPAISAWVGLGRMAEREKAGFRIHEQDSGSLPRMGRWGSAGSEGQSQCCSVWGGAGGRGGVGSKSRTNLGEGQV